MDGRGRIAEPVADGAETRPEPGAAPVARRARKRRRPQRDSIKLPRFMQRWLGPLLQWQLPRGVGVAAVVLFIGSSIGYGIVRGDHVADAAADLADARDAAANAVGFRITSIALAGQHQLTREEVLTSAGVTGRTSLLFLDAVATRARLKANPWIAEATVLKLYPGRLHIAVTERDAFALWQRDGKVTVISDDGTVVEPYVAKRFAKLPLVVGAGAEQRAKEFIALIANYPQLREQVQASVLVAERRWNLKLKNGINVRLPETDVAQALDTLAGLDRDKKLLTRDIEVVDLRLADRVTVRLSDEAAAVREEAVKPLKGKKKAGDA